VLVVLKRKTKIFIKKKERKKESRALWVTAIIPASREAESRRIAVRGQAGAIVCATPILKKPNIKNSCSDLKEQRGGPEFKPQFCPKNK
jgi:hypothetical protein